MQLWRVKHFMQIASDTADWISLGLVTELRPAALRGLLVAFGLPANILSANRGQLARHVADEVAEKILSPGRERQIENALDWLSQDGHALATLADAHYPQLLLQIPDPPPMLYVLGDANHLNRPALAIVGSRNATPQGIANARSFARAASDAGLIVVSGLALGIDTAAHEGALDGSGTTVAVLGCGVDIVYPRSNAALARKIETRGTIISEFALGMPPLTANFPRRNRIISGLSQGCLVVEATLPSGSLITARLAAEQGREVFAIPGSIHSPFARGCHALIRQGAKLVETAEDVLQELHLSVSRPDPKILQSDNALLQYIGYDSCGLDTLIQRSGLTAGEVSEMLLTLELAQKVGRLPGGLYQRIDQRAKSD